MADFLLVTAAESAPSTTPRTDRSYAVLIGTLACMWGSSYLFIRIGVETLPPLSLVFLRVFVGAAILAVIVRVTRTPLPRDLRSIGSLALLGTLNIAIPFWMIGWAEQRIDSGLAGILQSTQPFFTLVLSAALVHDERITRGRVAGIAVGFLGIGLLSVPALANLGSTAGTDRAVGEIAVVASSLCYGAGNAYARRALRGTRPIVLAFGQVGWSAVIVGILALLVDHGVSLPRVPEAALAVGWLGAIGTGFAYLVFFRILTTWGPTRASLVAYLLPVVSVVLGVIVLGERVDAWFAAGAVLIVLGVWVVNRRG